MTIIILKDAKRLASYRYKRDNVALKAVKGITAFYRSLYPTANITIIKGD
tara:strand:+ start:1900 stop:2049 length:150 start_codon:yes stop_codon:yes gene_type:complete